MQLSDFSYNLPEELIAQNPVEPRDSARLLVYTRATKEIQHRTIRDLPSILPSHTLLVANNSKVRHSRLLATRADGREIEILILKHVGDSTYQCMVRGRNIQLGEDVTCILSSNASLGARIVGKDDHSAMQTYQIIFNAPQENLEAVFEQYGHVPLPPYITDSQAPDERYQTVFASELGSAAAPTAGLHFTAELLETLRNAGYEWEEVTLHVGMGTFLPLRDTHIESNILHTETTYISPETAETINSQKTAGHTILAVGTTSTRTLESHSNPEIISGELETNMFIYPGYEFKTVSALMTNFHLPQSSLLTLVSAFIGNSSEGTLTMSTEEMIAELQRIYAIAIEEKYRFFSFGDAMLIL